MNYEEPSEHEEPGPGKPLTKARLERFIYVTAIYQHQLMAEPVSQHKDAIDDEYFEFIGEYLTEIQGLALAALGRIEPRRPFVKSYEKHTLGPVQKKIVDTLAPGARTHGDLLDATGGNDRNLRHTLRSMVARGTIVRGWDRLNEVIVFALPGVALAPVPEDRPHRGTRAGAGPTSMDLAVVAGSGKAPTIVSAKPEPVVPARPERWSSACPDFKVTVDDGEEPLDLGCLFGDEACERCGHELREHPTEGDPATAAYLEKLGPEGRAKLGGNLRAALPKGLPRASTPPAAPAQKPAKTVRAVSRPTSAKTSTIPPAPPKKAANIARGDVDPPEPDVDDDLLAASLAAARGDKPEKRGWYDAVSKVRAEREDDEQNETTPESR